VHRKFIYSGIAAGALAVSALAAIQPAATAMPSQTGMTTHTVRVCPAHPAPGFASCLAIAVTQSSGKFGTKVKPAIGFNAADIQAAYKLTGLQSGGRTVAIVDAFGYPGLEQDLATFRSSNGLPACTTANGCFKRMDQNGGSSNPPTDPGWDVEQALDVDAVSSACPDCHILVVQSNDNSFTNLEAAVNRAAQQAGVVAISNSYGAAGNFPNNAAYNHPGIAVVASSGDSGFDGGQYPAADSNVVGVGGTSVFKSGSTYTERVWSGAGSGCGHNAKPSWQNGADTHCATKAVSDVSAAADPSNGGLIIYCGSVPGCGGFVQVGGTSEASPIIGAVFALSGKTDGYPARYLYKKKKAKKFLNDITSGSNGSCGVPVCTARTGWDGPSGMGTPKGVKAF